MAQEICLMSAYVINLLDLCTLSYRMYFKIVDVIPVDIRITKLELKTRQDFLVIKGNYGN